MVPLAISRASSGVPVPEAALVLHHIHLPVTQPHIPHHALFGLIGQYLKLVRLMPAAWAEPGSFGSCSMRMPAGHGAVQLAQAELKAMSHNADQL